MTRFLARPDIITVTSEHSGTSIACCTSAQTVAFCSTLGSLLTQSDLVGRQQVTYFDLAARNGCSSKTKVRFGDWTVFICFGHVRVVMATEFGKRLWVASRASISGFIGEGTRNEKPRTQREMSFPSSHLPFEQLPSLPAPIIPQVDLRIQRTDVAALLQIKYVYTLCLLVLIRTASCVTIPYVRGFHAGRQLIPGARRASSSATRRHRPRTRISSIWNTPSRH